MNDVEAVKDLLSFVHDEEYDDRCKIRDIVLEGLFYENSYFHEEDESYKLLWQEWYAREHASENSQEMMRYAGCCWENLDDYSFSGGDILALAMKNGYLLDMDYLPFAKTKSLLMNDIEMHKKFTYQTFETYTVEQRKEDMIRFLKAVFHPDEQISYRTEWSVSMDDEYINKSRQSIVKVADLIDRVQKGHIVADTLRCIDKPDSTTFYLPDYINEAEVHMNPLAHGATASYQVSAYRYTVIEPSGVPNYQALQLLENLRVPITALVDGGHLKPLQALVRVDAKDVKEYQQRVKFLHRTLERIGLKVNPCKRHPNSTMYFPGVAVNLSLRRLLRTHMEYTSYEEWAHHTRMVGAGMGGFKKGIQYLEAPLEDQKEPIETVLQSNGKMMIAGPPKSGKTFLLLDLGLAVCAGQSWLGYKCNKGKVLYINFELTESEFRKRLTGIMAARHLRDRDIENLDVWNNLDDPRPMEELVEELVARVKEAPELFEQEYDVVIIDPVYCVMDGDENNASSVKTLFNAFSRLIREFNTAVVYCHHHNKSSKQQTDITERASGSSMFGRFPTALVDVETIDVERRKDDFLAVGHNPDGLNHLKIELRLRGQASGAKKYCWFDNFQFVDDTTGLLEEMCSSKRTKKESVEETNQDKVSPKTVQANVNKQQVELLVRRNHAAGRLGTSIEEICQVVGKCEKTVYKYLQEIPCLTYRNKIVYLVEDNPLGNQVPYPENQSVEQDTRKDFTEDTQIVAATNSKPAVQS